MEELREGLTNAEIAVRLGVSPDAVRDCLATVDIDVDAQIEKDRAHAKQRAIGVLPAVFVNQRATRDRRADIRSAIRDALLDESI